MVLSHNIILKCKTRALLPLTSDYMYKGSFVVLISWYVYGGSADRYSVCLRIES